jgi:hypothetical protein
VSISFGVLVETLPLFKDFYKYIPTPITRMMYRFSCCGEGAMPVAGIQE